MFAGINRRNTSNSTLLPVVLFMIICVLVVLFVCFKTCRSLISQPSTTQPVQLGVGDAGQDQSKAGATNAQMQPAWNPFDDDNFSNLPAEEFKTEDKKPAGKVCVHMICTHNINCIYIYIY